MSPAPFVVSKEELEGGIHAFVVGGELDLNTAPELEKPLEELISATDDAAILIDLSSCEFIDSTGIALIVRAWQRLDRNSGGDGRGRLVICCYGDQVARLLKITGVESSIAVHRDRDGALGELRG